jgi:hypothetical protein
MATGIADKINNVVALPSINAIARRHRKSRPPSRLPAALNAQLAAVTAIIATLP